MRSRKNVMVPERVTGTEMATEQESDSKGKKGVKKGKEVATVQRVKDGDGKDEKKNGHGGWADGGATLRARENAPVGPSPGRPAPGP